MPVPIFDSIVLNSEPDTDNDGVDAGTSASGAGAAAADARVPSKEEPSAVYPPRRDDPATRAGRSRARMDVGSGALTPEERAKHAFYTSRHAASRGCESILVALTDDDIEVLMETESENLRRGEMQRIFPSSGAAEYLK